jgi:two-component system chemotaxis response regulator CheY
MKILIAEDDNASRVYLKKVLSSYGECDVATDGIEALDLFVSSNEKRKPYDIIFVDVMMPKIDGLKVVKTIRDLETQNNKNICHRVKIIMTSALSDDETIANSYDYGCDGYLTKPINIEKVAEIFKRSIN